MPTQNRRARKALPSGTVDNSKAPMSGTWEVIGPAGTSPICRFVQEGKFFRGPCEGPGGKGVGFGILDGTMVRWSYHWVSKTDGGVGAFDFVGEIVTIGIVKGVMMGTTPQSFGQFFARKVDDLQLETNRRMGLVPGGSVPGRSAKLPAFLHKKLTSITPSIASTHRRRQYFPCVVRLRDGTEFDRVYLVSEVPFLQGWGFYPQDSVDIGDVVDLQESPTRLPPDFANQIYEAGESGMGYTIFTIVFSDGSKAAYQGGGAIDFIDYPAGKGPKDIVAVQPHVGRDMQRQHLPSFRWCLFAE